METMTVLEAFDEYEGNTRVSRLKGDELNVSQERADQLRERGLARRKPAARKREPVEGEVHGDGSGEPLPEVTEDPVTSGPHIDPEPAE